VGFKKPRFFRFSKTLKTAKAQCRFLGFYFYRVIYIRPILFVVYSVKVMLDACSFVRCNP